MRELGKICVSVGAAHAEAAAEVVNAVAPFVDLVEIRLDAMREPNVADCLQKISLPLLFTNRPVWEGGGFSGREEDRLVPLMAAARQGAAYVDLELRTEADLRRQLRRVCADTGCGLILSWHDFSSTPAEAELFDLVESMAEAGADLGKVVTTAQGPDDVIRVLSLLQMAARIGFKLSAFCMGEAGRISRFATIHLGGAMTYVAPDEQSATAPGQFSAQHFAQLNRLFFHAD